MSKESQAVLQLRELQRKHPRSHFILIACELTHDGNVDVVWRHQPGTTNSMLFCAATSVLNAAATRAAECTCALCTIAGPLAAQCARDLREAVEHKGHLDA